jgi:AcrR family transcriptional regulator
LILEECVLERDADKIHKSDGGTRERIFLVARGLFSQKGFKATSIRDITEAAGVNVAAVNYHFGGKEELYVAVVRERATAYRTARMEALASARAAGADLEGCLRAFVLSCLDNSESPSSAEEDMTLFFREITTPGAGFEVIMREMIEPTRKAFSDLLVSHVPGMTHERALWCLGSLMGQMTHFVRARRVVSGLAGREHDPTALKEIADHIVSFSLWGIYGKGMGA